MPIERVRYGTTDDSVTAFDLDDDDDDDDEELTGYYSKEHPLRVRMISLNLQIHNAFASFFRF